MFGAIEAGGTKMVLAVGDDKARLELFNDMGHIESFIIEKLHFEK